MTVVRVVWLGFLFHFKHLSHNAFDVMTTGRTGSGFGSLSMSRAASCLRAASSTSFWSDCGTATYISWASIRVEMSSATCSTSIDALKLRARARA